jgi:pimeloyl-ACP methyl ester carboxylesterase
MGGMISSVYAATYPGRVKAIVIVDSNLVMTPQRIANYNVVGNREGRAYATQEEFIANYRVRPGGSLAAPEVLRHIARHSGRRFEDGRWRHKVDRKVYVSREMVDSFGQWNRIRIPALLMKADRGGRITPEVIAELTSRAPQLKVAVVPDADHHITLDNPAGFIRVARNFLAGIG